MYCLPGMVRFSCFIDVLQGFTAILYFNISIANSSGEFSRLNLFFENSMELKNKSLSFNELLLIRTYYDMSK